jgi:hypothetical protein
LDTSFDGDGKVTTAIGAGDDYGRSVIQQADGKLVVAGHSSNGNNYDVALVRYDSGQLITTTNLWLKKLATKVGAGSNDDRWSAQYLYNADRRSGQVFDPATDALDVALKDSNIHLPAGSLLSKGQGLCVQHSQRRGSGNQSVLDAFHTNPHGVDEWHGNWRYFACNSGKHGELG